MIIPVRCFSCGSPISAFYEEYKEGVKKGKKPGEVLDSLGIKRYCCRRMLISHVDLIKHIAKFKKA